MSTWIRLECKTMLVGWTSRLPGEQYAAWVKLLQAVKMVGERGGLIAKNCLDPSQLKVWHISRHAFDRMINAAKEEGAIEEIGKTHFLITSWNHYQIDSTAAERKAEERERKSQGVTVTLESHGCHADIRDIQDKERMSTFSPGGQAAETEKEPPPPAAEGSTKRRKAPRNATSAQPREPDPIWDGVCAAFHLSPVTKSERSRVGAIVSDLKAKGASPEDIPVRLAHYKSEWPNAADTPEALLKHWDRFAKAPTVPADPLWPHEPPTAAQVAEEAHLLGFP